MQRFKPNQLESVVLTEKYLCFATKHIETTTQPLHPQKDHRQK